MKILIITAFFPPQNAIAALRPYSFAKFWSLAGHEVTVLTVPKKQQAHNSPLPFDGFNVVEIPVPIQETARKFIYGKDATTTAHRQGNSSPPPTFPYTIIKKKKSFARYGLFAYCRMPDLLDLWAIKTKKFLRGKKWDIVLSTAGPYSVHFPAFYLKQAGQTRVWIADWRDLWVDNHIYPGLPVFRSVEKRLERRFCLQADLVTTVSTPLAEILGKKYDRHVDVIYNGYDPDDFKNLPDKRFFPQDGTRRIIYAGTIYPPFQDPTPLFKAIRFLYKKNFISPEDIQIIFCGNNANVEDISRREKVTKFVQTKGMLPRMKALHMLRDADALLLLEFADSKIKGILTGKLFEYLYAGPPIMAIGIGNTSGIGRVLSRTGTGICYEENIVKIKNALISLKNNPRNPEFMKTRQQKEISVFSRQKQATKLLDIARQRLC